MTDETMRAAEVAPERVEAFLTHLAATSDMPAAARLARIPVATIRKWRREDAVFARRFDQAVADAVDDLRLKALAQGRFGRSTAETVKTVEGKAGAERRRTTVRDHAIETLAALERLHARPVSGTSPDAAGESVTGRQPPVVRDALIAEALAIGLSELVRRRMTGGAKAKPAGGKSGTTRGRHGR